MSHALEALALVRRELNDSYTCDSDEVVDVCCAVEGSPRHSDPRNVSFRSRRRLSTTRGAPGRRRTGYFLARIPPRLSVCSVCALVRTVLVRERSSRGVAATPSRNTFALCKLHFPRLRELQEVQQGAGTYPEANFPTPIRL